MCCHRESLILDEFQQRNHFSLLGDLLTIMFILVFIPPLMILFLIAKITIRAQHVISTSKFYLAMDKFLEEYEN